MSKYEEIKNNLSMKDYGDLFNYEAEARLMRADIQLLLKALELAAKSIPPVTTIYKPIYNYNQPEYWIERSSKEGE
jgi:hypothetical protein